MYAFVLGILIIDVHIKSLSHLLPAELGSRKPWFDDVSDFL